MPVFEQFAAHFIDKYPCASNFFMFIGMTMLLVAAPVAIFVLLKTRYNKGRYVFQSKGRSQAQGQGEALYMLDTMSGDIYWVDGKAYASKLKRRYWAKEKGIPDEPL